MEWFALKYIVFDLVPIATLSLPILLCAPYLFLQKELTMVLFRFKRLKVIYTRDFPMLNTKLKGGHINIIYNI